MKILKESKFDTLYNKIICEMNQNSFYPAKYIDGTQAVGTDFNGNEQIWMIGPTDEKNTTDFLTGKKLSWMTVILWLPNKIDYKHGIAISYDSYNMNKDIPEMKEKLASVGLIKEIDWENA